MTLRSPRGGARRSRPSRGDGTLPSGAATPQTDARWIEGPARPSLDADAVDVWRVALDDVPPASSLEALLDDGERGRACRFRGDDLRRRFVAAHAALRLILARYRGARPQDLRFTVGPKGKPHLSDSTSSRRRVEFNLAHSCALALVALARGRAVGIDIERVADDLEHDALADRYFTPREREALRRHPAPARRALFFTFWTRKEAVIKALGQGLSIPLDSFDVSDRASTAAVRWIDSDRALPFPIAVIDLVPASGYAANLAVQSGCRRVRCWRFAFGAQS